MLMTPQSVNEYKEQNVILIQLFIRKQIDVLKLTPCISNYRGNCAAFTFYSYEHVAKV